MAKKKMAAAPVAPVPDLAAWWRAQQVRGVIIGGLAVSLLGRPRFTRDLDALILLPEARWAEFLEAGAEFGFIAREDDALEFARRSRMLLLRHVLTGVDIDIAFGAVAFEEEVVRRAKPVEISGATILLPTPEDLVIMKAVAHREKDWIDIDGLLIANPKLNLARIRKWLKFFSEALEDSDIYDELEKRLASRSTKMPPKRKK